jgi:hypothetical protein
MPNFQKDPMTMPDLAGNQWARTGGLFGRNRASSTPTAKKQAPAANANPYAQVVNPAQPALPVAFSQNVGQNKLAQQGLYMPGNGPITGQVAPQSNSTTIVPSPTTPQPFQANQVGQFPPNAAAAKQAEQIAIRMKKYSEFRRQYWRGLLS